MIEKINILIVDDDQRMANTLKDILTVKGYGTEAANSGADAMEKIKKGRFDCVLTDIKMPEMNGVELYKAIKGVQPDIPVVLMTAYSVDELVKEGLKEGAIATLNKPLDIEAMLGFFSMFRKERSVVIVDDDLRFCKTLGDILEGRGFEVTLVTDPHGAVERIRRDAQVVLLDMKLNSINGLDLLKKIKKLHPHLPVILVTGYREEMGSVVEKALKFSAYTCLYKPLQIDELFAVLKDVRHQALGRLLGRRIGMER